MRKITQELLLDLFYFSPRGHTLKNKQDNKNKHNKYTSSEKFKLTSEYFNPKLTGTEF